jgi:hypothetical protein
VPTAVMRGRIAEDGNSIVDGIITWEYSRPQKFQMTWGSKLDTIPGSDHGRPRRMPGDGRL